MKNPDIKSIWQALDEIPDPEIPVVSLVEMGIVRDVLIQSGGEIIVTITPTFSGCPALDAMQKQILERLNQMGFQEARVEVTLSPPWSTNWISEPARKKLKAFGLAPPPRHNGDFAIMLLDPVACPFCDSENTSLRNNWGSTPCRMIFYCNNCQQPFEQFKPL